MNQPMNTYDLQVLRVLLLIGRLLTGGRMTRKQVADWIEDQTVEGWE